MDTTGPGCNLAIKEAITEVERLVSEKYWDVLRWIFNLCEILGTFHN